MCFILDLMDSGQSERNRSKGPKDNKRGRGGSGEVCLFIFFVSLCIFLDKDVSLVETWRRLLSGRIPLSLLLWKRRWCEGGTQNGLHTSDVFPKLSVTLWS